MNRILVTVFAFVLLCTVAQAGILTIDVLAVDGIGYTVIDGGKTVNVLQPGTTINFKARATISGSSAPAADSLQAVWGGFVQTLKTDGKVAGNMNVGGYTSPFTTLTAVVDNVDLNGDGLKDVGDQNPTPTSAGYFQARASAQQLGQVFDLGTFSLTDTRSVATDFGVGGPIVQDSTISYVKPTPGAGSYSFKVDNAVKNGLASSSTSGWNLAFAGSPVTIQHATVPEPSTLILLGMGCLALLAIRRRK
jgi:hypothetical protein